MDLFCRIEWTSHSVIITSVSIGIYAAVLHAINGMDRDLLLIAKDDELGRKLQDIE